MAKKNEKKSVFSDTEEIIKAHVESENTKVVDFTSPEDLISEELEELPSTPSLSVKQITDNLSFDLPTSEELAEIMKKLEEEDKDFINEDGDEDEEDDDKNVSLTEQVVTTNYYSNNNQSAFNAKSENARTAKEELEEYKKGIQDLINSHGYSFFKAKEIYENSLKQTSSNQETGNKIVQIIRVNN